jgi:hypothetical protein
MGISQVDYISSEKKAEDEDLEAEEAYELEGEGHVGPPPITTEDNNSWMYLKLPQVVPL